MWLAQNAHSLAGCERRLAHRVAGKGGGNFVQWMIQRKVPRNRGRIALLDYQPPVFFGNPRWHRPNQPAPRAIRVWMPMKDLPASEGGCEVNRSGIGIRHASSSHARAFVKLWRSR